jgi:hypothetical protein
MLPELYIILGSFLEHFKLILVLYLLQYDLRSIRSFYWSYILVVIIALELMFRINMELLCGIFFLHLNFKN